MFGGRLERICMKTTGSNSHQKLLTKGEHSAMGLQFTTTITVSKKSNTSLLTELLESLICCEIQ